MGVSYRRLELVGHVFNPDDDAPTVVVAVRVDFNAFYDAYFLIHATVSGHACCEARMFAPLFALCARRNP